MKNEIYTGTLVWGRNSKRGLSPVRVDKAYPAIIEKDTFDCVQGILRGRTFIRNHPRRTSSQYLLSGLIHCGHCGKALIGSEAKSGKFSYYICGTLSKKGAGACQSRYLNSKKLECLVVDKIKAHILTPENLIELGEMVSEELNANTKVYQIEIAAVEKEIGDIARRLESLYDAVETGKLSLDDLGPRIRERKERQEELILRKNELHALVSGQAPETLKGGDVTEYAADLKTLLETGTLAERKSFVRSFVTDMKVTGNDALLTYTLPTLPGKSFEAEESVLGIVRSGGQ